MTAIIPFLPTVINLLSSLLESIRGMLKDVNDAFGDFIKALKDKIDKYINMLDTIKALVERIKSLAAGPTIAILYLSPESGGVENFLRRIEEAELPADSAIQNAQEKVIEWTQRAQASPKELWLSIADSIPGFPDRLRTIIEESVANDSITDPLDVGAAMLQALVSEQQTRGFSGPSGYTGGIVLCFGAAASTPFGDSDPNAIEQQAELIQKSLGLIMALLASDEQTAEDLDAVRQQFQTADDWRAFLQGQVG